MENEKAAGIPADAITANPPAGQGQGPSPQNGYPPADQNGPASGQNGYPAQGQNAGPASGQNGYPASADQNAASGYPVTVTEKGGLPPAGPAVSSPPTNMPPPAYSPPAGAPQPAPAGAYPPGGAYPQAGYPPSQPYPQAGYPPPGGAPYPPAGGPYYTPQQPMMQQQQQTSVVVVQSQPSQPAVTRVVPHQSHVGQGALIFAAFVTIFAFLCCWWALFCAIPAVIFANNANSALDEQSAKNKRNISYVLSGVTLFTGLAGVAIFFGVIFA